MIITKNEFEAIKNNPKSSFYQNVDFGTTKIKLIKQEQKAIFEDGVILNLNETVKDNFCYLIDDQGLRKIAFFSSITNKFYKLIPTKDWPTISISSTPMHRRDSPKSDSYNKIDLIRPYGEVLDTCMGLGYTAILASQKAKKIITYERDETVFMIAKMNPLSRGLFQPGNILIEKKDVNLAINEIKSYTFDCIIHDPPTFKISPELFSEQFYKEMFRVLKEKGKVFHYAPLYKVKQGFDFPKKIKEKLKKTGFKNISYSQRAGGFLCQK